MSTILRVLAATAVCSLSAVPAAAQYSTVTSPFQSASNSFFEQFGVGFGFRGDGFFFQQNGAGAAVPPFGGFDPNAGATVGIGGPNAFLSIMASQGSSTSLVSNSPSITVPNGIPGSIFAGSVRPFVIGVIPVVGDEAPPKSPLAERLARLAVERSTPPRATSTAAARGHSTISNTKSTTVADDLKSRLAESRTSSAGRPAPSVAEIKRRRAAEQQTPRPR